MSCLTTLADDDVRAILRHASLAMMDHGPGIDLLDVDSRHLGDTGANLTAALGEIANAVQSAPPGLHHAARALATAVVAGEGRGASLLRRQLSGWSDVLSSRDTVGAVDLALALEAGADALDDQPRLAGSMAEISRAGADAALAAIDRSASLVDVARAANDAALDALDDSAGLRPALTDNGVVDAGGAGWVVLLDALVGHICGTTEDNDGESGDGEEPGRYAISLRLTAPAGSVADIELTTVGDGLGRVWSSLGTDVEVRLSEAGDWLAKVRCDDIGPIIEAALQWGRPSRITVEDTWSIHRR